MPTLRQGTSDGWIWRSVFQDNEYGLLDLTGRSVVDVGANIGAFACLAADRGATKVIAVEPFGPNFETLLANIADRPQIEALRRAIGATSGELITMRTTEEFMAEAAQKFPGKPLNFGGFHVGEHVGGSDTVASISLPDLMKEAGLDRIDVLKLDCESAEWPVFLSLRPEDFARIGELCGEYHLTGNVSVLGGEEPLTWLRAKLEPNGFRLELAAHETNPRLGWFYARHYSVEKPACEFLAKKHAKAGAGPQSPSEPELAALRKGQEDLRAKLASATKEVAALGAKVREQEAAIAELRRTLSVVRKARKLGRDPIGFFRDALRKNPG